MSPLKLLTNIKQEKGKLLYHLLSDVKSSLNKYEDAEIVINTAFCHTSNREQANP